MDLLNKSLLLLLLLYGLFLDQGFPKICDRNHYTKNEEKMAKLRKG
jgi:hypothetical protein